MHLSSVIPANDTKKRVRTPKFSSPRAGIEPGTSSTRGKCLTTELPRFLRSPQKSTVGRGTRNMTIFFAYTLYKQVRARIPRLSVISALDKLLGQLGIYATWLSSIAYLHLTIAYFHIFFTPRFFCDYTFS